MKRKRFSVEQVVAVLKQAEAGLPVVEVCRAGGDHRADLLSMEEAVRGVAERPGSAVEADCRRAASTRKNVPRI